MAQKFISLDEAAKLLGISKDHLNELRDDNMVRAYRDGASWKFRADDVERLAAEGIPALDASSSDISLSLDDEPPAIGSPALAEFSDIDLTNEIELGSSLELDLAEDESISSPAASDLSLEDLDEPTLPIEGGGDDDDEGGVLELEGDGEIDEFADSILLSENELGESTDRPPSTIIGKAEMAADLDLDLVGSESDAAAMSDVRLASPSMSNVFAPGSIDDVLDTEPPSLSDNFGDLDELEIDLEAESSRILSPNDITKAQQAAELKKAQAKAAEFSDIELVSSDSSSGGALDSKSGLSDMGLAGLSALELEGEDDDDVLGDGSDITLSSESSGINIISPSDSGLALDEVSLDLGSSAPLGSALDLDTAEGDVGLEPLEVAEDDGAEPFALTPFGEEASEDEDDSSQVIPLDEVSEEESMLGAAPRSSSADDLGDEFGAIPPGGMMTPVGVPAVDVPFSMAHVLALTFCLLLLTLSGMMIFDLLRNMWSWGEVYSLNSSLMDVLTPLLG